MENNTFVINDLVDTEKSLSSPLMKLNYFGRLTKNKELIEYTLNEIKGYSSEKKYLITEKLGHDYLLIFKQVIIVTLIRKFQF